MYYKKDPYELLPVNAKVRGFVVTHVRTGRTMVFMGVSKIEIYLKLAHYSHGYLKLIILRRYIIELVETYEKGPTL